MKVILVLLGIAIVCAFATVAYPYGALTVCLRINLPLLPKENTATATAGNFGLSNGSYSTWAEVDDADADPGSFANNIVVSIAYDDGPYEMSGTAYAYVNGYDADGRFQHDDDSDSN